MQRLRVWPFTDPGCPWAFSAWPALRALRWRYGGQLDRRFRRWGMPLGTGVKPRVAATSRACRALVAVRGQGSERLDEALRALQFLQFTTTRLLDDDDD